MLQNHEKAVLCSPLCIFMCTFKNVMSSGFNMGSCSSEKVLSIYIIIPTASFSINSQKPGTLCH